MHRGWFALTCVYVVGLVHNLISLYAAKNPEAESTSKQKTEETAKKKTEEPKKKSEETKK